MRSSAENASGVIRNLLDTVRLGPQQTTTVPLSDADTLTVLLFARYERIESWLGHRLRSNKLPPASKPATTLRTWSRQQSALGMRLGAVATNTVSLLASHGIGSVLLKGAAYHACSADHPFFLHRPTGDVDLLVEPGAADRAWQLLRSNGFDLRYADPSVHPDAHHLPTLMGSEQISVEIHSRATLSLDVAESWRRFGMNANTVEWNGAAVRVPPPPALLWHSIVHSLGDAASGCRLRALLTTSTLLYRTASDDCEQALHWLRQEGVRLHDARLAVPQRAMERWIAAAAWLAGPEQAARYPARRDPARALQRLLGYRHHCLARVHAGELLLDRAERRMEEATLYQFGFGLNRLGHWHLRRHRPRRLASSLWYQLTYQLNTRP